MASRRTNRAHKAWRTRRARIRAKEGRGGTRGALIKGMSGRLPSEILESLLFARRLREIMRGYAGIYVLYRRKKLYYVGLTTNLFGRIRGHLRDRHADKWDHFIIFRIQRVRYLKDIETLIQGVVESPGNKVRGKVPRGADFNRVLREVLVEQERATREIKKALRRTRGTARASNKASAGA